MVQFLRKPSSLLIIICPLWTIFIMSIITMVHGQYPGSYGNGPSPYGHRAPMAFSPYHPARINHETLPISQAEFAQLVAESMATSRGPHHHHPPNTDADYEGPDHWNRESTPSASSAPVPKSMHPNHHHVHPANRPYQTSESSAIRQQDPSSSAAAMYHHHQQQQQQLQQQRALAQSSMSMGHPPHHHQRQYSSPYASMRPQPTSASAAPSPYTNQYHPSDVESSSNDDDYRREPPAYHPSSQSMQYQPEESRFANSDDDTDDQYMRAPVFGSQQETGSEDEPEPHTYGGRPSTQHDYSNSAQANYHAISQQRHPGHLSESDQQQIPSAMHDYQNDRVHPMTAAMLQHQHQASQSVPESMSGPSPIGPQPMYHPNDPSSLAYHQDFSKQMNRANYHPSAPSSSSSSSPVHPFSSHGVYPGGYPGHSPRPLHPSAAHLQRMQQMYGDGSNHQANYYNHAHHAAAYARHHQHPHAYPHRPEDMYMAASSETDSSIASPDTTDPATGSTEDDKSTKTPAAAAADKSD